MKNFTNHNKEKTFIGFPLFSGKLKFSIPILINQEDLKRNYQTLVNNFFLNLPIIFKSTQNIFCFLEQTNFRILNENKEFNILINNIKKNSLEFYPTVNICI